MKRFGEGLLAVIMVVCFMGFIGYDFLTPVKCNAAEEKAVKAEKATKEVKKEPAAKAAAPAKKAKKKGPPPVVMLLQQAPVPIIELAKSVKIDLIGTGFEPQQELRILYTDADGMQTDIGYALSPEVKANSAGVFITTWTADEFIKAKLVVPGAMTLTVTNNEFKPLAEMNIFFKAAPKAAKAEKKADAPKEGKAEKKEGGEKKEKKAK